MRVHAFLKHLNNSSRLARQTTKLQKQLAPPAPAANHTAGTSPPRAASRSLSAASTFTVIIEPQRLPSLPLPPLLTPTPPGMSSAVAGSSHKPVNNQQSLMQNSQDNQWIMRVLLFLVIFL